MFLGMSKRGTHLPYKDIWPKVDEKAFVAPNATLIGDVEIGPEASIWFGVVIRGDVMPIRIGARSSVQDLSMFHATRRWSETIVGEDCTIGHSVTLHGCKISDRVLIGMGSCILDGAEIASDSIVGAGSLVTTNTKIPSGVLALGSPAKPVRDLQDEERKMLLESANNYVVHSYEYREIIEKHGKR